MCVVGCDTHYKMSVTNSSKDVLNSYLLLGAVQLQGKIGYEYQCSSITRMCVLQTYAVALQHEANGCGVGPNGLVETQRKLFQQSWKGQCMNMVKRNSIYKIIICTLLTGAQSIESCRILTLASDAMSSAIVSDFSRHGSKISASATSRACGKRKRFT